MTAALLSLLLAAAPAASDVVARVDATAVTRADLEERLRVLAERGEGTTPPKALDRLVDEALLAAEARRQGIDREPAVAEELAAQRRRLLTQALAEDLAAKAELTDEALRRLYHSSGDSIRLVLVKLGTREEAAAALARVKGGGDLAEEAKRSLDPTLAGRGGDTGPVTRAQLDPALAEEAFRAAAGALVGPVQLKLGWAIARVTERSIADEAGFAERREALASFARRSIAAEARRHLAEQLKARHGVQVDEAFLRSLGTRADATPAELDHVIATVNGSPIRYRAIHPTIAQIAAGVGHGAGPSAKISFARQAVEEQLLAAAAQERGLGASPVVARVLPGIERNVLASALVARLAAQPSAGAADPKVSSKLGELRARAKIKVDEAKLPPLASPHR